MRADRPPFALLQTSREAISASVELKADEWAPEFVAAAQDSLTAASREIDRQIGRFFIIRDYDLARVRLGHASRIAREAVVITASRRDSVKTVALANIAEAKKAIDASRRSLVNVQMDGYSRSKLVTLDLIRQEAVKAASDGRYRVADAKARTVIAGAETIQQAVYDKLGDYRQNSRIWNNWANDTVEWSRRNKAHAIIVRKLDRRCDLYYAGRLKASYAAELGIKWMGHKTRVGDHATPEGRYHVITKKAGSRYHKALEINYPNDDDRRRFQLARQSGRIGRSVGIGGLIEIHGHGGRGTDWTQGCVALRNSDMDALFATVNVGTPVTIVGDWGGEETNMGAAR